MLLKCLVVVRHGDFDGAEFALTSKRVVMTAQSV